MVGRRRRCGAVEHGAGVGESNGTAFATGGSFTGWARRTSGARCCASNGGIAEEISAAHTRQTAPRSVFILPWRKRRWSRLPRCKYSGRRPRSCRRQFRRRESQPPGQDRAAPDSSASPLAPRRSRVRRFTTTLPSAFTFTTTSPIGAVFSFAEEAFGTFTSSSFSLRAAFQVMRKKIRRRRSTSTRGAN